MKTIVSLTSFPLRINIVHNVINAMLNQTVKPDKIILYLTESEFPDLALPKTLTDLIGDIFEVRFFKGKFRSYTKLIPALSDFPNDLIITVDDDCIYQMDVIEKLLKTHKKYPTSIIAHRVKRIAIENGIFLPYKNYKTIHGLRRLWTSKRPSFLNLQTGVGGVLYPPKTLYKDVLRDDIFISIAPTTDDLWFWAMAVLKGTKIKSVPFGYWQTRDIIGSQTKTLRSINVGGDGNDIAMKNILDIYPRILEKLKY